MAKKKTSAPVEEKKVKGKASPKGEHNIKTSNEVTKEYGSGVVFNGSDLLEREKAVIGVSPALDNALGGGFQEGSLVVISGPPRSGKSTTSLHFCAKAQRAGRRVVYLSAETRLESRDLMGIPGLDPEKMEVVQSYYDEEKEEGKILSAQDYLSIAEKYLMKEQKLVMVIDSISIMCDEKEMNEDLGKFMMGGSGKLVASFCRRMGPVIAVNKHIVIAIGHLYANLNPKGKKWLEAIGGKVDYQLSTKMRTEFFKPWTAGDKEDGNQIGQEVYWKIERTPLGPPNKPAVSWIRYGKGIDEVYENVKIAESLPMIIEKGGTWYTLNFLDEPVKFQGIEKTLNYLYENPDAAEKLDGAIKEIMSE